VLGTARTGGIWRPRRSGRGLAGRKHLHVRRGKAGWFRNVWLSTARLAQRCAW